MGETEIERESVTQYGREREKHRLLSDKAELEHSSSFGST